MTRLHNPRWMIAEANTPLGAGAIQRRTTVPGATHCSSCGRLTRSEGSLWHVGGHGTEVNSALIPAWQASSYPHPLPGPFTLIHPQTPA